MKKIMCGKILVLLIKQRKFESVDYTAYGINDTSDEEP
jgi:hypothetical protein